MEIIKVLTTISQIGGAGIGLVVTFWFLRYLSGERKDRKEERDAYREERDAYLTTINNHMEHHTQAINDQKIAMEAQTGAINNQTQVFVKLLGGDDGDGNPRNNS